MTDVGRRQHDYYKSGQHRVTRNIIVSVISDRHVWYVIENIVALTREVAVLSPVSTSRVDGPC